jgi:ORF57
MDLLNLDKIKLLTERTMIPPKAVANETGVAISRIEAIRDGKMTINDLSFSEIRKLHEYIQKHPPHISFDYSEIIEDLKLDISKGVVGDNVFVVRDKEIMEYTDDYHVIIDYVDVDYKPFNLYYEFKGKKDVYMEVMNTKTLLHELERMNNNII